MILCERYGVDAIRYFLLREITVRQRWRVLERGAYCRINSDLANDLGNLLSRTVAMVEKYFGGTLPEARQAGEFDGELKAVNAMPAAVTNAWTACSFRRRWPRYSGASSAPTNILTVKPPRGCWRKTRRTARALPLCCITCVKPCAMRPRCCSVYAADSAENGRPAWAGCRREDP